jgi:hypothetical protein
LLQNVLETLLCGCFQSLPAKSLTEYFGSGQYSGLGLNVLPPLLQNDYSARLRANNHRERLRDSPDPEIRQWPDIRSHQIATTEKKRTKKEPITMYNTTSRRSLQQMIEPIIQEIDASFDFEDFINSLQSPQPPAANLNLANEFAKQFGSNSTVIQPRGAADAKIGLILDNMAFDVNTSLAAEPWVLNGIGLNTSNCLLWTYNHTTFGLLDDCSYEEDALSERCDQFSKFLLGHSNLQVVLLCGPISEQRVVQALDLPEPKAITLRGQDTRLWIRNRSVVNQNCNNWQVIFSSPEPLAIGLRKNWREVSRLGEILKATCILSGIPMDFNFLERNLVYTRVHLQIQQEKLDPKARNAMTPGNLHAIIRQYLHRKGFKQEQDLVELESIGGSLARGINLLTSCCLPHRAPGVGNRVKRRPLELNSGCANRISFTSEEKERARSLYARVMKKIESQVVKEDTTEHLRSSEADDPTDAANAAHEEETDDQEMVGYEDDTLSPAVIEIFTQLAEDEEFAEKPNEARDGNQGKTIVEQARKTAIRLIQNKTPLPVAAGPRILNADGNKLLATNAIRTHRLESDNPYLRTSINGSVPVKVQCSRCLKDIGQDPQPTYAVLPPFQGFYITPAEQHCYTSLCNGQRSGIRPVNEGMKYVSYKDMANFRARAAFSDLYSRLQQRHCFGNENVDISQEELNMVPWYFQRK